MKLGIVGTGTIVQEFLSKLVIIEVIPPDICERKYGNDANLIGVLVHYMKIIK